MGCVSSKESKEHIRYDPAFYGPVHNRSCTDTIWLVFFILFLGIWGYIGYYSITRGNVERLIAPVDSRGRRCGLDSGLEEKKYLVFFNIAKCLSQGIPITGCPTPQVCTQQCPNRTVLFNKQLELHPSSFDQLKFDMVCTDDVNVQSMTHAQALQYIQEEKCASFVLESQPVLGRCFLNVTNALEVLRDVANDTINMTEDEVRGQLTNLLRLNQVSSQIVQDLVRSRWYIVGALVAAVFICVVYILLLRWIITPVVWISIASFFALMGFVIYLCYKNYEYHKTNNFDSYVQSIFSKYETWLIMLIVLVILFIILLLVVVFLRSRISVGIELIREGSKAVTAIKSTYFFPILPWIFQCATIAYGIVVFICLLSIGNSAFNVVNLKTTLIATVAECTQNLTQAIKKKNFISIQICMKSYRQGYGKWFRQMIKGTNCLPEKMFTNIAKEGVSCNPATFIEKCRDTGSIGGLQPCQLASCHFTGIYNPYNVIYMQIINILGFIWVMSFISGVADMMLASTFSTWYWTFNKNELPFFTFTSCIYRIVRYHMGTVALGSLIIVIVRIIRVILEFIDHQAKKFDNLCARCVMCFCKCMFWCLENFLKFINRNAYIICAVHGKNFCRSARDAFSLLMRNIFRVVLLDKVADFIFFLSKLLISIGVGLIAYYLLEWNYVYEFTKGERLHYNYVPATLLSITTFYICTIFFKVYSMAINTLFLCFLEDCERNDGSVEKPYFMPKNLMKILGKRNRIENYSLKV